MKGLNQGDKLLGERLTTISRVSGFSLILAVKEHRIDRSPNQQSLLC